MRVLVTGGRDYDRWQKVHQMLDALHARYGIDAIIEGRGGLTDLAASSWAQNHGVQLASFPAQWEETVDNEGALVKYRQDGKPYNALAGLWRNQAMLHLGDPHLVLSFPGGRGTAHMTEIAIRARVPTLMVPDLTFRNEEGSEDLIITFLDDEDEPYAKSNPGEPWWACRPTAKQKIMRKSAPSDPGRYLSEAMF